MQLIKQIIKSRNGVPILYVEAKLHDESRLIQRCFDDNKDDDKGDD